LLLQAITVVTVNAITVLVACQLASSHSQQFYYSFTQYTYKRDAWKYDSGMYSVNK